jgi:hypothetical protein
VRGVRRFLIARALALDSERLPEDEYVFEDVFLKRDVILPIQNAATFSTPVRTICGKDDELCERISKTMRMESIVECRGVPL